MADALEEMKATLGIDADSEVDELITEGDIEDGDDKGPFSYDEDSPNLVDAFNAHPEGREALRTIANDVVDMFDREWEATGEYRERMAADLKILACDLPKKDFPYENSANCSVPIMLENVTRLSFRTYAELFGDWSSVCGFRGMGPEYDGEAEVLTLHTNWQIREQITDFKRQQHRGIEIFFAIGNVTCHSYYDEFTEKNRHEMLTPAEFITPYTYSSAQPDYSDVPWKAKILLRYRHELQRYRDKWSGVDKLLSEEAPDWSSDPEQSIGEEVNRMQGREMSDDDKNAPYRLIWWEGWLELPNQANDRYCQVIVEHRTRAIMKLSIHELPDWQDKLRFERESAELDAYRQQESDYTSLVAEHQAAVQEASMGLQQVVDTGAIGPLAEASEAAAVDQMSQMELPPPPAPPSWLEDSADPMAAPAPVKKTPIHLFAHGVCIEPIVGNLGLSYGRIEADFNRAANTALSQFTDAATLANVWSIITTDQVKFDTPFQVAPGKVNKVKAISAEELRNSIIELKPQAANPQLMEVVDKMYGYGQTAMQAPSVLSGEPGKSGETYRGLAARIEQATKQLSVAAGKYKDFLEQVLKNNCLLNSIFLKDEEIIGVTDSVAKRFRNIQVGRHMYERNYKVEVKADLRFTSMAQRVAEADEIVQMGVNDPMLANNVRFRVESIKQALLARGRSDLVELLQTPEEIMAQQQAAAQQAAMQQQMAGQPQGGAPPGAPPGPEQQQTPMAAE